MKTTQTHTQSNEYIFIEYLVIQLGLVIKKNIKCFMKVSRISAQIFGYIEQRFISTTLTDWNDCKRGKWVPWHSSYSSSFSVNFSLDDSLEICRKGVLISLDCLSPATRSRQLRTMSLARPASRLPSRLSCKVIWSMLVKTISEPSRGQMGPACGSSSLAMFSIIYCWYKSRSFCSR